MPVRLVAFTEHAWLACSGDLEYGRTQETEIRELYLQPMTATLDEDIKEYEV